MMSKKHIASHYLFSTNVEVSLASYEEAQWNHAIDLKPQKS